MSTYSQTNNKIILGAELGICIAFIVATLTLPHLDILLWIALGTFVFAIPVALMAYYMLMLLGNEVELERADGKVILRGARLLRDISMCPMVVGFVVILWHFSLIIVLVFFGGTAVAALIYQRFSAISER